MKSLYSFAASLGFLFPIFLPSLYADTVTWVGGSGDWDTPANWSTGDLPGAGDDVVIGPGPAITVTHSTGADTVHSVQSQQAFVLSGGALAVSTTFQASNTFTLSGGTLQSATVVATNGFPLAVQNGTLDGVTIATNSTLDVGNSVSYAEVTVTNGLVLNGTLLVGNPSNYSFGGVSFAETQTLSGNGTVVFGGGPNSIYNGLFLAYDGTTLTIGSGITIRGQNGTIGGFDPEFGGSRSASVVNQGTISCDVSGGTITINPQTFTSTGTFNGSVQVVNGTTILGGTIPNGSGLIMNSGVTLDGVTVNGTLDVGNSLSDVQVTVTNGLVLNGTLLVGNPTNYSFGGVGFAGTQTLSGNGTVVFGGGPNSIYNGLFLAYDGTTLTIGSGITVRGQNGTIGGFDPEFGGSRSASVVNQGTISCDVSGGTIALYAQPLSNVGLIQGTNGGTASLSGTLTPSASGTLNGSVQVASGATILGVTTDTGTLNGSALILNSGVTLNGVTVAANTTLDVGNTVNEAEVTVINGLVLNGTLLVGNPTNNSFGGVSFAGTQTLSGNGTVVFGVGWYGNAYNALFQANDGTTLTIGPGITVRGQNGTIGGYNPEFGGSQSASLVNQGTISCDVSGGTIYVNPQTFTSTGRFNGPVQVANGTTIQGGTIVTLNGSALILQSGVTLDGVTVNGNLDVGNTVNGADVTVTNGLVLNGTLLVGNPTNNWYGGVGFAGSQSLSGNGTVVFGDANGDENALYLAIPATTLTLSAGIVVRGQNGLLGSPAPTPWPGSYLNVTVINQGTISCDVNGGTITIEAQTFTSTGRFNGPVQVANGTTILGGTIVTLNGSALILNSGVTLDGVTVNGNLDVGNTVNDADVTVTNGLVLNGTLLVGNPTNRFYGGVGFAGSQSLSGNGTVVFGNANGDENALYLAIPATTLTLSAGIVVRGQNGLLGSPAPTPWPGSYLNVTVINQGTISCDVNGGTITIEAQPFANQGALRALAGTVVSLTGSNTLAGGSVTIGIGGLANYGRLNISGDVPLSGALNVNLSGGYVPTNGSAFTIATYGSDSGSFDPVTLPGQGLQWQLDYGATSATLTLTNDLATLVNIAYLRSTLDPVNFAPTNTTAVYTALGVVTTWTNLAAAGDTEFYMQDASGGIAVHWSGANASSNLPPAGSVVEVTAPLGDENGLLVLAPVFSNPLHGVTIQGTNNLPDPQPLPFDTNFVSQPELMVRHLQGSYFLATNVFLDLGTSAFTAGASEPLTNGNDLAYALSLFNSTDATTATNYTVGVTNQTGQTFIISYNTNADFIGQRKLPGPFAVYGVLGQYVTNTPYTSGYRFIPTRAADLIALGPPQIVGQPTNQLLTLGGNAAFAVTVTGSSPLSYQWLLNGASLTDSGRITGSQSNLLSISSVQSGDVGLYDVVVTNMYGSVTSAPAILSVSNIADLALSSASAPALVTATQPYPSVQMTWAVTNLGVGTAPGGWYDRVWFSTNGVLDANSVDVGDHYVSQSVAPGTGYSPTIPVTLPLSGSGAYWLFVQVDVYDYIIESSKANNLSAALPGTFTLVLPDLAPVSVSAPASALWGSAVPVACVVTNLGSGGISNYWADGIYYSTNAVFGSDATVLAFVAQNHAVVAGGGYAWTNMTALPPVVAGTYYLFVVVNDPAYDGGAYTIYESTRANNTSDPLALTILAGPAPTLLGVTPSIGLTNGGTAVTVAGTGFEPGAQLFFGGQTASSVSVSSSTRISALTPAGPLGVVSVSLMNPDGNGATLPGGYIYTGPPPSISGQPVSLSVPLGSNAVFQVTASGTRAATSGGSTATT